MFNAASGFAAGRGSQREAIKAILAAHGVRAWWHEAGDGDTGAAVTGWVAAGSVETVLASGGDGTVMACAGALAGTPVPLGVIPGGTGNIIGASLRIPHLVSEATEVALHGRRVQVDLAKDGAGRVFFAASIGFGAAVMRDATPRLKARVGMAAYALSAARHALDVQAIFRLRLDGQGTVVRKADGVLLGNLGQLRTRPPQPRTTLDDGALEVAVLCLKPIRDWLRGDRSGRIPLCWYQARQISIECNQALPEERDGDWIGTASRLDAQVLPGSLLVCAPDSALPVPSLVRRALRDAATMPLRPRATVAATSCPLVTRTSRPRTTQAG